MKNVDFSYGHGMHALLRHCCDAWSSVRASTQTHTDVANNCEHGGEMWTALLKAATSAKRNLSNRMESTRQLCNFRWQLDGWCVVSILSLRCCEAYVCLTAYVPMCDAKNAKSSAARESAENASSIPVWLCAKDKVCLANKVHGNWLRRSHQC